MVHSLRVKRLEQNSRESPVETGTGAARQEPCCLLQDYSLPWHRDCPGVPYTTFLGSCQRPILTEMLILSCSSKLRQLEATLWRRLPETLQVHGAVMTINRGNPAGHEVVVDSWPEFKTVLTRPRKEVASDDSDFYTNMYAAYYRDLGAYRDLLASAVNWNQAFIIHGLRDGLYEASRDIANTKGVKLEVFRYFTYFHPDPSTLPEIQLDPTVRLSTLDVSRLNSMNEMWPYGGNKYSKRFLENLIRRFSNFCLLNSAGHLLSWTITDQYGAMGRSVTLPEHRGRGYNGVLNILIAKRLQALGYPSYGHVAADNYPMQRLQERQGFQRQPNLCHFIIHNAALHRTPTLTPKPAPGTAPA